MSVESYRWAFILLGIVSMLILLVILAVQVKYRLNNSTRLATLNPTIESPTNIGTIDFSQSYSNSNFYANEMKKEFHLPTYNEAIHDNQFFTRVKPPSYIDSANRYS